MYNKKDSFWARAKSLGYRSRAAFKLLQIQRKFKIIRRGNVVLDLGAAPGSWVQVSARLVGRNGHVHAIDLLPMSKFKQKNVSLTIGDITDNEVLEKINHGFNVVLSDMAPRTSGIKARDAARNLTLAEVALKIALAYLKPRGNFVVKILEGSGIQHIEQKLKQNFGQVKRYRPKATRKSSREVYLIGLGFK